MKKIKQLFFIFIVESFAFFAGCVFFVPLPEKSSISERINELPEYAPLKNTVIIRWNGFMIPYIEAENNSDLAFTTGLIHSHMRISQMEMMKRISQGRIAEFAGPIAADIDYTLRILNPGRAAKDIYKQLLEETKNFLDDYVRGINYYLEYAEELPHEFNVLNLKKEKWTAEDLITIVRFSSVDLNWMTFFALLKFRNKAYYSELFNELIEIGASSDPTIALNLSETDLIVNTFLAFARTGSNSFAISPKLSTGNSAIIANDPHVGITLPNLWFAIGLKSPDINCVGLSLPGLPFILIGRNHDIAWGGTNMRASSSEIFVVSDEELSEFTEREEIISVRWLLDKRKKVRESSSASLISDSPLVGKYLSENVAIKWLAHYPGDELTPLLKIMRAKDWDEFRTAFKDYSTPGMNILYADKEGNIAFLPAAKIINKRFEIKNDFIKSEESSRENFFETLKLYEIANFANPDSGAIVSCNNMPVNKDLPVAFFFPPNQRFRRINNMLFEKGKLCLDDIAEIQRDTKADYHLHIRDKILTIAMENNLASEFRKDCSTLWEEFSLWNGFYDPESAGALAFQLITYNFAEKLYQMKNYDSELKDFLMKNSYFFELLERRINQTKSDLSARALEYAVKKAAAEFCEFRKWGEFRRLRILHFLFNFPIIGGRYIFDELAASGSIETVLKANHRLSPKKEFINYGSNARQISDMSDPDGAYLVLLGGQDGKINSQSFCDQIELWTKGKYIQMPLTEEKIKKDFPLTTHIKPIK